MKKLFLCLLLVCSASESKESNHSSIKRYSKNVIKNASYVVFQGDNDIFSSSTPASSRYATFFTADGKALKTIEHKRNFKAMQDKLDPSAPKPQAAYYQIKYWPGIQIRAFLWFKVTKGVPGDFIIFYDGHGNKIDCYRFDQHTQEVTVFGSGKIKKYNLETIKTCKDFPLDLSKLR